MGEERILVLVEHEENRHILGDWLSRKYSVIQDADRDWLSESFDLAIFDSPNLDRLANVVKKKKEAEDPVFLPSLLVTSRTDVDSSTRHLWQTIDELILTPVERVELEARVEMLLRTRKLSQKMQMESHERLMASEERFRLLAENAKDLIYRFQLKPTRRFDYVSPSSTQITGYTPEEHYADPDLINKLVHPDDRSISDSIDELSAPITTRWVRKDGSIIWAEQHNTPITDEAGEVVAIEGIVRDISERKRGEEALHESEERYRMLVDYSPTAITVFRDEKVIFANPGAVRLLGAETADDLYGRAMSDIVHPDYWKAAAERNRRMSAGESIVSLVEDRHIRLDGSVVPVEVTAAPFIIGGHPAFQIIALDISERQELQRQEREQRMLAEALLDTAAAINSTLELDKVLNRILENLGRVIKHDGSNIMIYDDEEDSIRVVRSYGGYNYNGLPEPVLEKRHTFLARPHLQLMLESFQPLVIPDVSQYPGWIADEDRSWIRSYAGAPICIDGKCIGLINVDSLMVGTFSPTDALRLKAFSDQAAVAITNAKLYRDLARHNERLELAVEQRTVQLRDANETLKALDQLKDAFVSNVSHELRTPITCLRLNHRLIGMDPGRQDVFLERIGRDIDRLDRLIEGVLRLSWLDQGRVELKKVTIDLNKLASGLVADRELLAKERGLTIHHETDIRTLPMSLDEGLIEQALSVLLTNALNYTPIGGIVTVSTIEKDDEGIHWAGCSVRDNGPGIPEEELDRIFERFHRGKVGLESGKPGTGLGLNIAQKIVEQHGGMIDVSNRQDGQHGAVFTIWLPED